MFDSQSLLSFLTEINPSQRILIAYSGGLDSQVLLHALANLNREFFSSSYELIAIHINHQWSPEAKNWEQHCQNECEKLNIPCKIISIDAKPPAGKSAEAHAREMRYAALSQEMKENDYLLTAHQHDDQAETLLIQLFRGAGVKGLASMPVVAPFSVGFHARPLLEFSREELHEYAQRNHLTWIEDESNSNLRFDRNYIRHELMPVIKKRWPRATHTLSRTAKHCAQTQTLLENTAQNDFQKIVSETNHTDYLTSTLPLSSFLLLDKIRQRNVLRYWLEQQNLPLPNQIQLEHILNDVIQSEQDSCPIVQWGNIAATRYQNHLYILPAVVFAKEKNSQSLTWDLTESLTLPQGGFLESKKTVGKGISFSKVSGKKISVQWRKQGERFHPSNRQGSHPLKKLFQEWKIPPWERISVPLIYADDLLIAVVPYAIAFDFVAKEGEEGIVIEHEKQKLFLHG